MTPKVLAIVFSACKAFVAIADAAGVLSLYKVNGTLLFGHSVVRTDGLDSVVCIKFTTSDENVDSNDLQNLVVVTSLGSLLRLRNLKLAEFEQKLFENNKDISSEVLKSIRSERANVGRLRENALSCVLVHRFQLYRAHTSTD
ncbi:unnamed protein product [Peronospora destructor]|uniref:Uncharacterized protein n=1 Tax=Peronospora destructor TaxID=86335 RepID=A0AAV0TY02_9STRA|nr:unnamed protein product [Peronospora destructor]